MASTRRTTSRTRRWGRSGGRFDQRAAEKLNRFADGMGFDAIQVGGEVAWVMEGLHEG